MKISVITSTLLGERSQEVALYRGSGDNVFVIAGSVKKGGGETAKTVANTVGEALGNALNRPAAFSGDDVYHAVSQAQTALTAAHSDPAASPAVVGTLALSGQGIVAAHVGDVRLYHVRPSTGEILYRSKDHTLVNYLFQIGHITRRETRLSARRHILTRALQPHAATAVDPDLAVITDVEPGDCLVMCNSRVTDVLTDKHLLDLLVKDDDTGFDELTRVRDAAFVLVKVTGVEHEEGESLLVANEKEMSDPIVANEVMPRREIEAPAQAPVEGDSAGIAPVSVPAAAGETGKPLTGTGKHVTAWTGSNKNLIRAGLILLAGVLLAGLVTALFHLRDKGGEKTVTPPADTVANNDVRVDSLIPEMPADSLPADSLPMGSSVDVPRAAAPGGIALPPRPAKDSYSTGSSVRVPRKNNYNYGGDEFGIPRNYNIDESKADDDGYYQPGGKEEWQKNREQQAQENASSRQQSQPEPAQQASASAVPRPSASQAGSYDPARSRNNGAVPPPARKNRQPAVYP